MRLSEVTAGVKARGEKGLVAFLTAGYPDEATFGDLVRAASAAGCTAIEIGIPFSDPIADGPVIQHASKWALDRGMTLARSLELARELAGEINCPLLVMTYVNPIMNLGLDRFARDAAAAGIAGVIAPDVSVEESTELRGACADAGLDYVDLLAPTSSNERVARIAAEATGFVYLVSMTGVTGASERLSTNVGPFVERVRAHTRTPLYVGFGISTPAQAADVAAVADGVIIGSQLIRLVADAEGPESGEAVDRVGAFLGDVKRALAAGIPDGRDAAR